MFVGSFINITPNNVDDEEHEEKEDTNLPNANQ